MLILLGRYRVMKKRDLKANPGEARVLDSDHINPIKGGRSFLLRDLPQGESVYVTNHPKRTWFAKVTMTENGLEVK